MQQEERDLSVDDVMNALADVQRRKLLIRLLEHSPREDSPVVIADSDTEADTVEHLVMMQHAHLPKLADYGIIEWNDDTHEVLKGPMFDEVKPLLELLDTHEDELPPGWV